MNRPQESGWLASMSEAERAKILADAKHHEMQLVSKIPTGEREDLPQEEAEDQESEDGLMAAK